MFFDIVSCPAASSDKSGHPTISRRARCRFWFSFCFSLLSFVLLCKKRQLLFSPLTTGSPIVHKTTNKSNENWWFCVIKIFTLLFIYWIFVIFQSNIMDRDVKWSAKKVERLKGIRKRGWKRRTSVERGEQYRWCQIIINFTVRYLSLKNYITWTIDGRPEHSSRHFEKMFRRVFRVKVELTSRCEGRERAWGLGKLKQGGKKEETRWYIRMGTRWRQSTKQRARKSRGESLQSKRDNEMKWLFKKASLIF